MAIRTALTERLGIEHPILCAPMARVSGGKLAAAVSEGGGLGLLGGAYCDESWITEQLQVAGNARIGIGLITWRLAQLPNVLDLVLDRSPAAVMLSFGDEQPFATRIKDAGSVLIAQVQSLEQAKLAADAGADIIVAQGGEAGGHGAQRGAFSLVPEVVDALPDLPVVAAGGIADGRGLAAALALGASGVLLGTRFVATEESLAPEGAKAAVAAESGDVTVKGSVFDKARRFDWPAAYSLRTFRNAFSERWEGTDTLPESAIAEFEDAVARADMNVAPVVAGEAAGIIRDVPSAKDVIPRLVAEAEEKLRGAAALCGTP
ncbi:NAD(P)H-dependent flavin oxidoreductase [Nisaea sp.]|uniref:NAD(P)H-dependent flavin oxidoreductase n=1 Tax=Nisaea sp. TaxID=2024842 RepID=UPI003B5281B5